MAVELDAKVIVDLALSNKSPNNSYFSLLNECRYLLGQFQQVKVSHVFCEANRGVDSLTKRACSLSTDFAILDVPPNFELNVIVNSYAYSLYSLRLLATTSPFMAS